MFDEFYLFTSPNEIEDGYKWCGTDDYKLKLVREEKIEEDKLEVYKKLPARNASASVADGKPNQPIPLRRRDPACGRENLTPCSLE